MFAHFGDIYVTLNGVQCLLLNQEIICNFGYGTWVSQMQALLVVLSLQPH